jgi:L-amino acid N-acyltransferase YncA
MTATLRPATLADVPAITAIYREAVEHGTATFETEPPDEAEMRRRFEALAASGHPYLVAEADGQVLGYAYAGPYRPRPAYRFTVEDSIYLRPEARGQGLGSTLLAALIDEAQRRGFCEMIAVIGDSANAGSVGVHRRLGFQPVGTFHRVGFKFGRWLDTVLMQRTLREREG